MFFLKHFVEEYRKIELVGRSVPYPSYIEIVQMLRGAFKKNGWGLEDAIPEGLDIHELIEKAYVPDPPPVIEKIQYTHVKDSSIVEKFKRQELEVDAGSVVLMQSTVIHNGYPTTKEGFVRITITERFNPLQKIPFLKDENAPIKIPYVGVDYNKILD